jgi:cation transport regulator ChaB
MTVDSINNNNVGMYTVGSAALGAGAGISTAYLTRPFLKDGAPTDAFIKKMDEKVMDALPQEVREATIQTQKAMQEFTSKLNNAATVDEFKNIVKESFTNVLNSVPKEDTEAFNEMMSKMPDFFESLGVNVDDETKRLFNSIGSKEECLELFSEKVNAAYDGKTLEELKKSVSKDVAELQDLNKKATIKTFEQYWDASKKTFKNCEDEIGQAVKKAARSIQGKYAMIYGAIGAAALGLVGYLCAPKNDAPQQAPKQ